MNRFTTRATVLALVLLLAAGGLAFAELSITIETGATYDLTNLGNVQYDPNLEVTWSGDIGDYNSYKVTLQNSDAFNNVTASGDLAEDLVQINEAYFMTDLLGSLGVMGVPVAASLQIGYDSYDLPGYGKVTKKEEENIWKPDFEKPAFDLDVLIQDQIGFEAALDMGLEAFFAGLTADISPVQAEVGYSVDTGETSATGDVGGGVEVALPMGGVDLAVGGEINYDLDTTNTQPLDWGVGLRADLGVAGIGASANSSGGDLQLVNVEANANLMDGVALEAYVGLLLAPGTASADTLDLLEIALVLGDTDPFLWRIGFVMTGAQGATGDKYAPGTAPVGASAIYIDGKLVI
jgi:hypothetical protein